MQRLDDFKVTRPKTKRIENSGNHKQSQNEIKIPLLLIQIVTSEREVNHYKSFKLRINLSLRFEKTNRIQQVLPLEGEQNDEPD